MSKTPGKRLHCDITPTKPVERIQKQKTYISPDPGNKMADTKQPVNKKVPWDMGRELSVEIHSEIESKFADISDRESILIRNIVDKLEARMNESFDYLCAELNDMASELNKAKQDVKHADSENQILKQDLLKCKRDIEKMEDVQIKAEIYSRRSNLRISGPGLSKHKHNIGNTEHRLRSWFRYVLNSLGCRHIVPTETSVFLLHQ